MYELFNKRPERIRGTVTLPEFIYIKDGLNANLLKVIEYYRSNPKAVRSSHFLVKLLQSIGVSRQMSDIRFVDQVFDRADKLSMSLKMTSPSYDGDVFEDGIFYGREMTEVLISASEDFAVNVASNNWEKLQPIRVLSHPKTDMNLDLPLGEANGSETGISVIAINIPMLALQYKKFREQQQRDNPDNQKTPMQFVCMYPLPNMLLSHLDVAFFNRFYAHFQGIPPQESELRQSFHLIDYTDKVDQYMVKLNELLQTKEMHFDTMLASLPMIAKDDLYDIIQLPKVVATRQILWAFVLARVNYISFLLQMNFETDSSKNRSEMNDIERNLRRLRVDKDLKQKLPEEHYDALTMQIENGIQLYL